MPYSLSPLSAIAGRTAQALGEPGQRPLEELHRALRRGREGRRERESREIEGGRKRLHLEVADRDDTPLVHEHQGVRLRGIELDSELGADETESVAGGTVLLGDRPERERVLQVAGLDLAALEQRSQAGERGLHAGVRTCLADRGMHRVPVRAERLEIERSGVVEHVEEDERICERECTESCRKRALVEQGDRLARNELQVVKDPVREVGHLGQIALADRAEGADLRQPIGVQRRHEMRGELGPGHRRCRAQAHSRA